MKKAIGQTCVAYIFRKKIGFVFFFFFENFESLKKDINFNRIFIGGFNYLTESQKKILNILKSNYEVHFSWDIDNYYYSFNYHEAGKYFRTYNSLDVNKDVRELLSEENFTISSN